MAKLPRITVFQPDPTVPLCRFDDWLKAGGVRLSVVPLTEREVPQLTTCGDAILVLGGHDSALDTERSPWLPALGDLLADALSIGLPMLGICLGHQIFADVFGGKVQVDAKEQAEEDVVELSWLPEAKDDPVFAPVAQLADSWVIESHNDVVIELPAEAKLLASSSRCPIQAFSLGTARGVQFHPEADRALMLEWCTAGEAKKVQLAEQLDAHAESIELVGKTLATSFAQFVRAQ